MTINVLVVTFGIANMGMFKWVPCPLLAVSNHYFTSGTIVPTSYYLLYATNVMNK